MTRREALSLLAVAQDASRLPAGVPPGIGAIMANALRRAPGSFNTDWFGTCLMEGLLRWAKRGFPENGKFAQAWFETHLSRKDVSPYSGNKSRTVNAGGIAITTYAGHYGLAFPCYELVKQTGDERARRVCLDIADIILHQSARNRFGMVGHDDFVEWAIPDVCYFAVRPLMMAFDLSRGSGAAYREQAVFQLRTYIDHFLVPETGIAKTILLKTGPGKTYWCRATGWLLWSITSVLRHLSPGDPAFGGFAADLKRLAAGIARHQDSSGGLHLYVDDPASPLELTGSAMCAMGLHEAVRRKWLAASYGPFADRLWGFAKENIGADGKLHQVFTGWAVPAESGEPDQMDRAEAGWALGFMLATADEMTAG